MPALKRSPLNIVLGAANVGDTSVDAMARFDTTEEVNGFLEAFAKRGYRQIDTARMYSPQAPGTSEARLGAVSAGDRFLIDTKVSGWEGGHHTKNKVALDIDTSLEAMKINQVNIEYLHVPDRQTPFEESCEAMDRAFREGKIKHWGLSNYTAAEVQRFIDICEERGFVKPSVYQGQYNPVVRAGEKALFPVLRRNGMAFYAFSPASAGFFAGNYKKGREGGRFDRSLRTGEIYADAYGQESIHAATDKALQVISKHGIGGHAAALRWTVHHSMLSRAQGDSVIVGASSVGQLEANLDMIEQGPLPDEVVAALETVYDEIGDAIPYHL